MTFSIGCDPEVFVKKNGKAISAYGLVEGDKKNPKKTERGAYQVDGMALEFNTNPVNINDFDTFNLNIVQTMKDMRKAAGDVNFNISPVQEFDEEYLAAQPDEAKELGCDPDYNAYTMEQNPRPDGTRNFRTGAGHIHIGWGADIPADNPEHFEICANFIKMMDLYVGCLMTCLDRDPRRRELYGKAGAFRPKSYGVEYRTPSNVWITNKNRRWLVHYMTNKAINAMIRGYDPNNGFKGYSSQDIRAIIDDGKVTHARQIITDLMGYDRYAYKVFCTEFDTVQKQEGKHD